MRSPAAATRALRCQPSVMSPGMATTPSRSSTATASAWASRASTTTCQPRSLRARTSARPRPRDAPVTIPTGMPARYEQPGRSCQGQLVLGPGLDESRAYGRHRSLRAVGEAKFCEDVADVGLDRLLSDTELTGDQLVREAAADQHEHLTLARGQAVERLLAAPQ